MNVSVGYLYKCGGNRGEKDSEAPNECIHLSESHSHAAVGSPKSGMRLTVELLCIITSLSVSGTLRVSSGLEKEKKKKIQQTKLGTHINRDQFMILLNERTKIVPSRKTPSIPTNKKAN